MTDSPDSLTPEERQEARDEFVEIAQEEEIAEGDITVSETVDGEDPTPDIDDFEDKLVGEDDIHIDDDDNPELGLNMDGLS